MGKGKNEAKAVLLLMAVSITEVYISVFWYLFGCIKQIYRKNKG